MSSTFPVGINNSNLIFGPVCCLCLLYFACVYDMLLKFAMCCSLLLIMSCSSCVAHVCFMLLNSCVLLMFAM